MSKKLVVIGSINNDLVIEVPKKPVIGETVFGRGFIQVPGGKGSNQAVAASRLGADVSFIGAVGDDGFGAALIESLSKNGVDIGGIKKVRGKPTATAMIILCEGDNYIAVDQGANVAVDKKQIDDAEKLIAGADMVILQLEIPVDTVLYAIKCCKKHGIPILLNPAPAPVKPLNEEFLEMVDLLTPNESETFALTGINPSTREEAFKAAKILTNRGVKQVVITLGSNGCVYGSGNEFKHIPAEKVDEVIDTTAAGDSFSAALAVSLAEGSSFDEAASFATKVGGITVTRKGAQPSLPFRQEIK